jgi:hypothetical protein
LSYFLSEIFFATSFVRKNTFCDIFVRKNFFATSFVRKTVLRKPDICVYNLCKFERFCKKIVLKKIMTNYMHAFSTNYACSKRERQADRQTQRIE